MTAAAASPAGAERTGATPVRFILNTFYSGPQAWFFLADDRGYFRDEGLEVTFTEGDTLARAVPRLASGAYDAGYGCMNALIEMLATGTDPAPPRAVFIMHNRAPYTIALAADGPVRDARDLAGRRLVSHPDDAAWRLFPEFCRANGLDPDSVTIEINDMPHSQMVPHLLAGRWDGIFGFVNTIAAQAIEAGVDPATALRHLTWADCVPPLYGAAVMVSQEFLAHHPGATAGLVRAINRGLADTVADPDAAIDAVARRNPQIDRAANRARLTGTLAFEMSHPDGRQNGLGDADDARLTEAARLIATAKGLPHRPAPDQIFDHRFVPALADRVFITG